MEFDLSLYFPFSLIQRYRQVFVGLSFGFIAYLFSNALYSLEIIKLIADSWTVAHSTIALFMRICRLAYANSIVTTSYLCPYIRTCLLNNFNLETTKARATNFA